MGIGSYPIGATVIGGIAETGEPSSLVFYRSREGKFSRRRISEFERSRDTKFRRERILTIYRHRNVNE